MTHAVELARKSIAQHSKSFSLAARLLPVRARDTARVVYAWCRRADDAIDLCPRDGLDAAAQALFDELDVVYSGKSHPDPIVQAFAEVVREINIPKEYPLELLRGMRMDADDTRYDSWDDLLLYCHRVAGTVGLMMCHVLGVRDARALRNAAHLGIGMQLTNIARDVAEDWQRGRLYVPNQLLARTGAPGLARELGGQMPASAGPALAEAVRHLVAEAEHYYRSADEGLEALDSRCAWAVGTARAVYADIGRELARRAYSVEAGRVHVGTARKLFLSALAGLRALVNRPLLSLSPAAVRPALLDTPLRFPDDIVPL